MSRTRPRRTRARDARKLSPRRPSHRRVVIDLHCHILPGIDDGPETTREALELARQLARAGVRTVAATPHLRDDHPGVRVAELAHRCGDLTECIQSSGIALEVIPAAEVDVVRALEATDEERRLASFGQHGNDMLLEAPYGPLPTSFEEQIFELSVRGYRILLAHPERNPSLQRDPARLDELVRRGVLLQVTASALLPRPAGSRSGRFARSLVENKWAHVLASDAHGPRGPQRELLGVGLAEARALVGTYADWMVEEAPAAILAGEALPPSPTGAAAPARRSLRERLIRREHRR
jgi:protein-tyrosine phosphatase